MIERRSVILLTVAMAAALLLPAAGAEEIQRKFGQEITVYKNPSCSCCAGWVDYLKTNGFRVEVHDADDLHGIKVEHGVTDPSLMSCHTAVAEGYVIEGHVPADDIWRLLSQKPDVVGITAPGMPQMSPGMHSIEPKDYDVLTFDTNGETAVYSRY